MYSHHKILASILFAAVTLFSYNAKLILPESFVSNTITFLSIVFGFYLTGLSILFGSNFSKRLGQEEDMRKKTQTKLHTLRAYFKFSSLAALSSIFLLLLLNLMGLTANNEHKLIVSPVSVWIIDICVDQLLTAMSLGLVAVSIMFMSLLFRVFFNAFLEEGS